LTLCAAGDENHLVSDLFSVSGKTALVTGGSRGIGLMIARGLVERGARVYISSRKADVCEEVAAELSQVGECHAIPADLATEEECRRLAGELSGREDHLDVLVNNAGATWGAPLVEHDEAILERVLALNVKAVFHLTKFLIPLLEAGATAEEPSRVVNIGSIDGLRVPDMEVYGYSASKAVNAIAPGPFESKMMAATLAAFGDQIAASAPLHRIGRPDDMVGATIYLVSRAGAYVTGTVLPVDGGIATLR
jgi:NAD(P)-dependent dehydrogenase (short-subunit alcohol dehydrogenase family)